jgi:hypothetical protein
MLAALIIMAAGVPEWAQDCHHPERGVGVGAGRGAVEGRPQIIMLQGKLVEPGDLIRAE